MTTKNTGPTDRIDAVRIILAERKSQRITTVGSMQLLKAAKLLGMTKAETLALFQAMDYAREDGQPFLERIKPIWLGKDAE